MDNNEDYLPIVAPVEIEPAETDLATIEHEDLDLDVDDGDEHVDPEDLDPEYRPDVDEYYWKLRTFVQMVARGEHDAMLVQAPPGLGKSYQINRALEDEVGREGYISMSGYITPVELYHALYATRSGQVLFLDDIRGVVSSKKSMSLLKQATWTDATRRVVEWRSTSSKIEAPEQFEYRGRVIMCFNEVPDNEIFESLKNRALPYQMDFTYDERMDIIREIAKVPYKDLTEEERLDTAEWIEKHTIPGQDVSLRVLFHVMDCRSFEPDRWRELASDFVEIDEDLAVVQRLLDGIEDGTYETTEEAAEQFQRETGKTRRTFFRKQREVLDDT